MSRRRFCFKKPSGIPDVLTQYTEQLIPLFFRLESADSIATKKIPRVWN